jgi:hypothetical protein
MAPKKNLGFNQQKSLVSGLMACFTTIDSRLWERDMSIFMKGLLTASILSE